MNIIATILARNEEDIIAANLEHHINLGINRFIVTLNCSTDSTRDIIRSYSEVAVLLEDDDPSHNQSRLVSNMAKIAAKLSPDWIIHLDADEFWESLPKDEPGEILLLPNMALHFPGESMDCFIGINNDTKVMHRPIEDIVVLHGNHGIKNRNGTICQNIRHHYPIRSFLQFQQKVKLGHEAMQKRNAFSLRWKFWYSYLLSGELEFVYEEICKSWLDLIQDPNNKLAARVLMDFYPSDTPLNLTFPLNIQRWKPRKSVV